jgi:hypothetical protein
MGIDEGQAVLRCILSKPKRSDQIEFWYPDWTSPEQRQGVVNALTRTYHMDMLKRELPVTHCTQCGGAGYNSRVADRRCSKNIAGERCNGTNARALKQSDWEDCSNCESSGYYRNKECPRCQGVGYLFVRPKEEQAVI